MFNENLKSDFIEHYTNSAKTKVLCESLFNSLEKYENSWNADICTRNKSELEPVIDEVVSFRSKYKMTRLTILRNYARYCISLKVPGTCDGILQVSPLGLNKMKKHMISNPLMLQMYLDSLYEPEFEETTNNIYRCFYWLAYAGVDEEDILNIKCSDVDFDNMLVRYNGLNYPIYRESIPAFRNCALLTQFKYLNPNHSTVKYINRVDGDQLLKGIKSIQDIKTIRVSLSRTSKRKIDEGKTTLKLSYNRVYLSGMFYRKYETEMAGISVNFNDEAAKFIAGKTYKFDSCRKSTNQKLREISQSYYEDYQRWKLAFNL